MPESNVLRPAPTVKVERIKGDDAHVLIGCLEYPAGYRFWLKVPAADLPEAAVAEAA